MSEIRNIATRHGPMLALAGDWYITRSLMVYGEYSPAEAAALDQMIKPGMAVIEVGANIGTHTIGLARRCAPAPLYAFEPQHRVFQVLCANLALNDIRNVQAYPEASGAAAGFAEVPEVDYGVIGNFGGVAVAPAASPSLRTVRVTPIDDLPLETCGLIKVDVEGWEIEVLKGATLTITRFRPILYVENDRADKQQALIDLIASFGYRLYWHTPPLFSPNNYNGVTQDIFGGAASCNMFCLPAEESDTVQGLQEIDPKSWTSPISFKG